MSYMSVISFLFFKDNISWDLVFLSAAEDILKDYPSIPKSSVLIANIMPCIVAKLAAPHLMHIGTYRGRILLCVALSFFSLNSVAWFKAIWLQFLGIIMASAGSGLGETTFLAYSSFFKSSSVVAWSSGTGAAGIVGALLYWLFSSIFELSLRSSMLISCVFPFIMLASFFYLMKPCSPRRISFEEKPGRGTAKFRLTPTQDKEDDMEGTASKSSNREGPDQLRSLSPRGKAPPAAKATFIGRMNVIRPLLLVYIVPLFITYFAEYVINQGVFFSLLYPIQTTPFRRYRDHYVTYQAIYQSGVFLSRSFGTYSGIRNIWIFAILQILTMTLLIFEAYFSFIKIIWIVFVLVFWEGLLGGSAYVNAFYGITKNVASRDLEFSMAVTGVADSIGIGMAGLVCLAIEPWLCDHHAICNGIRNGHP